MANIEALGPLDVTGSVGEINGNGGHLEVAGEVSVKSEDEVGAVATVQEHSPGEGSTTPLGSGAVPLKGNDANESSSGSANPPPLIMPHPKKFSHVNINKKFLEKASSATTSGQAALASPLTRTASSSQKPVLQQVSSHSRLVTAKLTATPPTSTTTGPGWSRPSSTVSSGAPTPLSTNARPPSNSSTPAPSHVAPLPPSLGKVIQPQPRNVLESLGGALKKEAAGKSAWGNAKLAAAAVNNYPVQNDFPTAAEVAQGRTAKLVEKKQAAQVAAAQKQAVSAEEDTFRGVHLDPNAHHWDEMEEDDDNFLDGVIEFGDGRQYKIQPEASQQASPPRSPHAGDGGTGVNEIPEHQHVSKEERFADDFDRSWPRSRHGPSFPSQRDQHSNGPASSVSSQSHNSPQEASRVLFNERLGRLEPYQNSARYNSTGPSHNIPRRGSRSEHTVSPTDSRGFRDAPPHHMSSGGVQLLQKVNASDQNGSDAHSRAFGDHFSPSRRDAPIPVSQQTNRATFPDRHRMGTKDHYHSFGMSGLPPGNTGAPDERTHGDLAVGPPMHPPSQTGSPRDGWRQLPPHLSHMHPAPAASSRATIPTDNVQSAPSRPPLQIVTQSTSQESKSKSPLSSHKALSPLPGDRGLQSSTMPLVDLDQVRKAAMHSAAERAKIRRQQEEEEREKERERARRKAAELEEKMKALAAHTAEHPPTNTETRTTEVTQAEVITVIEEAVQSVITSGPSAAFVQDHGQSGSHVSSSTKPIFARASSGRGVPRPDATRRTSILSEAPFLVAEKDSWRNKANSGRPSLNSQPRPDAAPASTHIPPPLLTTVDTFPLKADEDLEIVDFSDLGKLVGVERPQNDRADVHPAHAPNSFSRPPRAVAMDFFDDDNHTSHETIPRETIDDGSWRRKPPPAKDTPGPSEALDHTAGTSVKGKLHVQTVAPDAMRPEVETSTISSHIATPTYVQDDPNRHSAQVHPGQHRVALNPSYREAPMSTLNDVISRIKGALHDMHTKVEPPKAEKWLPPALRPRVNTPTEITAKPTEVFDVTISEPPRSPRPWNVFTVKFPQISQSRAPTMRKHDYMPRTYVRWDIYSWDPPLENSYRRDIPINDVLFRKPHYKGSQRYTVRLPKASSSAFEPGAPVMSGPVVNLPARSPVLGKQPSHQPSSDATSMDQLHTELNTVSRSPPPRVPSTSTNGASLPKAETSVGVNSASSKPKLHQKMPAGSDVAFYRDSRVEVVKQPNATVSFIVNSELEHDTNGSRQDPSTSSITSQDRVVQELHTGELPMTNASMAGIVGEKSETGENQNLLERSLVTPPPSAGTPWMKSPRAFAVKDSPARAPDPEHLKAVWSQTSDQGALPAVNSLEGIADDLTAVPFTLQEVKSEDGETPPPSGSGPPSRMSLHDVTRAFQQVPSPSSSSHRGASLSMTSPGSRPVSQQPTFAFVPPSAPNPNIRPVYAPYASPMMSHSPSSTVMYPPHPMAVSPVPRPVMINGASPQYAQPMWMQVSPGQPPGGMMRAVASPYPAQLMPFPSPGGGMPIYTSSPPGMQGGSPQQPHGMQGRAPVMMSPGVQHASHTMYAGSPVMMPTVPQPHNYPVHHSRGVAFDQTPGIPTSHSSQHSTSFAAIPPNSFARPTW